MCFAVPHPLTANPIAPRTARLPIARKVNPSEPQNLHEGRGHRRLIADHLTVATMLELHTLAYDDGYVKWKKLCQIEEGVTAAAIARQLSNEEKAALRVTLPDRSSSRSLRKILCFPRAKSQIFGHSTRF